jgi:hypothetical protein
MGGVKFAEYLENKCFVSIMQLWSEVYTLAAILP